MGKNVILIMADQFRGDCLGCMGHPDVKTPYLDTLAAQGTLFDRAYSACPSCIPARAALHTGMSQEKNGRVGYEDGIAWDYSHTLAGELSAGGYYTQCVGKMHVHPLRNLLGYHNVELHDGYLHYYRKSNVAWYEAQKQADDYMYWLKNEKGMDADVIDGGPECNSWVTRPWMYEENTHPTNWVTSRAIDFLRRRDRDRPFFLTVSYVRPHPPFDAPKDYFDLYRSMTLRAPALGDWENADELEKLGRVFNSVTGPSDPEMIRQAMIGYYACITHLDHQIGRLIQTLIDDGVYEDSLIIFTSDHGEELCDHHLFRKAMPYEGSTHIPLIISGKYARDANGNGQVCHSVVELRDLMPTILAFAGIAIPKCVDGESLLSLLHDPSGRVREMLHGEHSFEARSNHWMVTQNDKYIWFSQSGREQYFVLETDPRELHDRIQDPDCAQRIAYLRGQLIETLKDREEGYSDGERLIAGRTPVNVLGNTR